MSRAGTRRHTPGPWRRVAVAHGVDIIGSDDPRPSFAASVCTVSNDDDRQGAGAMEANARMIAAAPELLAALVALVGDADEVDDVGAGELRQLEGDGTVDALDAQGYMLRECIAAARAAVAKARIE